MVQRNHIKICLIIVLLMIVGIFAAIDTGGDIGSSGSEKVSNDTVRGPVVASSGPACFDNVVKPHGGWIHVVAHGEQYDVTVNATIMHSKTDVSDIDISENREHIYEIEFTTQDNSHTVTPEASNRTNCEIGTKFKAGASIPSEFEKIHVVVNGEVVQTVEKGGTFATLRPLPNPINSST